MGQGERIEISNPCPLTPSLKRSLKPQGIKKSLNLHFRPNPIFVAMSLIIILISGLAFGIARLTHDSVTFLLISFAQIITLGAVWKMLSGIIEFDNLRPRTIFVAMSLIIILISGRLYLYSPIISFHPEHSLVIIFTEIMVLGIAWKMLSEIREYNKTKPSIAETGIARGVDWQWVLIGFSFLLLLLGMVWWLNYYWSPFP
ncbi:MAG: hypothetical protein ACFFC0_05315 [Promethearchaeota archaeon]